jgi:hypothetical protein
MSKSDTYIQYGVPSNWAKNYESIGISATTFRNTPKKDLISKYKIASDQIDFVKNCLTRQPIVEDVLQELLEANRFVCCLCKGQKGDGYIIHHIEPYASTQDNEHHNLAVLCPNDHDLVHREGQSLTNKITKEQLVKAKHNWEKEVEVLNVQVASQGGEINEVDFINVPRILELYNEVIKSIPKTKYSESLLQKAALNSDGSINSTFIEKFNKNPATPFIFFGLNGSWELSLHFEEVFKEILTKVEFIDLDSLLNKKAIQSENLIGKFCFYVGGLYGNRPERPITVDTECTHLYFHRKSYFVEWIVAPQYMKSSSSITRLSDRTEYLIYGRIRSIGKKTWKDKEYIHFSIRPYLFGLPTMTKTRKPAIHFTEKYKDYDFDEED